MKSILSIKSLLPQEYLDMSKVLAGTLTRNFGRGLFKILVAGFLAPQAFGILRAVYSLFKIIASIASFGLNFTMVKFVALAIENNDKVEKEQILKAVLCLNLLSATIFVIAGNIFAETFANVFLGDPTLTIYVRLVFVAIAGQLMWKFIASYLSSHQQFGRHGCYLATMPVFMLLAAVVLIITGNFSLPLCVAIYLFAPAVAALCWWLFLDREFIRASWSRVIGERLVKFSRWIYLTNVASVTRNHANTLLLKSPVLSGSMAVGELNAGLYSFGGDLANEVTVVSESLLTVLLPKASSKTTPQELLSFVRRSYRHLLYMLVPLAALMLLAKHLIYGLAFFKSSYIEYLPSLSVFVILYTGALFSLAAIPMKTALYALNLPHVESYLEVVMLFVLITACVMLIPVYGANGAAFAVLFQRILSFLFIMFYGKYKLQVS